MPCLGTIFRPRGERCHRWIVISQPKNGQVLCVSVTDEGKCPHSTCKIKIGEHCSITKPSAISYRFAREFPAAGIDREVAAGTNVDTWVDCSPELVGRIIDGAKKSDDLFEKFLHYL